MKYTIPALLLVLLSAPAAYADAVHVSRVDLFATCIASQNQKQKKWMPNLYTPSQLEQLDPFQLKSMSESCACTVKEAFDSLSQGTIQAFNTSMKEGVGDIIPSKTKASMEFQKAGMTDKQIACNEQGLKSSGLSEQIKKLSK